MGTLQWEQISGAELEDALEEGFGAPLPGKKRKAVYAWKRRVLAPHSAVHTKEGFLKWVESLFELPWGVVPSKRLSHYLVVNGAELKPTPLSGKKLATLDKLSNLPKNRKKLIRFIEESAVFSPPLYVGETGNLATRIREHMRGQSNFGAMVNESELVSWQDLELHYFELGNTAEGDEDERAIAQRTLMETLLTSMSLAGYVERRG